jgi:hypothetical protein
MTLCVSLDAVTTITVIIKTRLDSDVDDDITCVRNVGHPALEDGYMLYYSFNLI